MKIKKIFIAIFVLLLATLLTSCDEEIIEFEFPDYNVTNQVVNNSIQMDEGVNIDGVLNESFWDEALENNKFRIQIEV